MSDEPQDIQKKCDDTLTALQDTIHQQEEIIARLKADIPVFEFTYINYQGKRKDRKVRILGFRHGTTQWYPSPCWLLRGFDMEKKAEREFCLDNMRPLGSRLVVDYDSKQVLLGMLELLEASGLMGRSLLEGLHGQGNTLFKLGGAGNILHRNTQRVEHIAQRLVGTTEEAFDYKPPVPVAKDGTVSAVVKTMG